MKYILKREMLVCYEKVLIEEEKSQATIEKYMRDVRKFFQYVEEMGKKEGITKEIVLSYKRSLIEEYAPSSVNSMLASLNHFFKVNHWYECCEIIENTAENFSGKRKRTDKRRILQIIAGGTKRRKISFVLYSSDNMRKRNPCQ